MGMHRNDDENINCESKKQHNFYESELFYLHFLIEKRKLKFHERFFYEGACLHKGIQKIGAMRVFNFIQLSNTKALDYSSGSDNARNIEQFQGMLSKTLK